MSTSRTRIAVACNQSYRTRLLFQSVEWRRCIVRSFEAVFRSSFSFLPPPPPRRLLFRSARLQCSPYLLGASMCPSPPPSPPPFRLLFRVHIHPPLHPSLRSQEGLPKSRNEDNKNGTQNDDPFPLPLFPSFPLSLWLSGTFGLGRPRPPFRPSSFRHDKWV